MAYQKNSLVIQEHLQNRQQLSHENIYTGRLPREKRRTWSFCTERAACRSPLRWVWAEVPVGGATQKNTSRILPAQQAVLTRYNCFQCIPRFSSHHYWHTQLSSHTHGPELCRRTKVKIVYMALIRIRIQLSWIASLAGPEYLSQCLSGCFWQCSPNQTLWQFYSVMTWTAIYVSIVYGWYDKLFI